MSVLNPEWTFWTRTKWLFTGNAPSNIDQAIVRAKEMSYEILERELQLIEDRHLLVAKREQLTAIEHWANT